MPVSYQKEGPQGNRLSPPLFPLGLDEKPSLGPDKPSQMAYTVEERQNGTDRLKPDPHFYDVLELPPFASAGAVKAAYRQLARQHHPDLNQHNRLASEERLKRINQAYDVLKDPTRKAAYDSLLRQILEPAVSTPSPVAAKTAPPPPKPPAAKPVPSPSAKPSPGGVKRPASSDAKNKAAPSGKPLFGWLFDPWQTGGTPSQPAASTEPAKKPPEVIIPPAKGAALESPLVLTPAEAESGCIKSIPLTIKTGCEQCAATGRLNGQVCRQCGGARTVTTTRVLEVKIPAGAKAGAKIKVPGEGYPSPDAAGPSGDLVLTVQLPPDPQLAVKGLNVYLDWPVSVPLAVLGGVVQVPTVHGDGALTIPAGSQPGQVLRLKGQGVHQGAMTGDQFVTLQIPLPSTLSPKARKLYEQLRQLDGE
jgi:molecular chaperone DnaJ